MTLYRNSSPSQHRALILAFYLRHACSAFVLTTTAVVPLCFRSSRNSRREHVTVGSRLRSELDHRGGERQLQETWHRVQKRAPRHASFYYRLVLCLVPVAWGTYTPAVKLLYSSCLSPPSTMVFNMLSYACSLATMLPLLWLTSSSNTSRSENASAYLVKQYPRSTDEGRLSRQRELAAGVELGAYLFLGSTLHVAGIRRTTSARAAVLVQLSSLLVPLAEALMLRRAPSLRLSAASALSLVGVGVLSRGGHGGLKGVRTAGRTGDLFVAGAAAAYSTHIIRLSQLAPKLSSPLRFASLKSATEMVLSMAAMVVLFAMSGAAIQASPVLSGPLLLVALWNGSICTGFTMWAQSVGQTHVTASEAALIYATQPIWGTVFAALAVGERPTVSELRGLGLLVAAMILSVSNGGRGSIEATA